MIIETIMKEIEDNEVVSTIKETKETITGKSRTSKAKKSTK